MLVGLVAGLEISLPEDAYFSVHNSPYPAHRRGAALDVYHDDAPFPFEEGRVLEVRRFTPPPGCWEREDYAILVGLGGVYAKFLHLKPGVRQGEVLGESESLGRPIMSSYLRPWSDPHYHLEVLGSRVPSQRFAMPIHILYDVGRPNSENTLIVEEVGKRYALCRLEHGGNPAFMANGLPSAADAGIPHYQIEGTLGRRHGTVYLGGTAIGEVMLTLESSSVFKPLDFRLNGKRGGLGFYLNWEFVKVIGVQLSPGDWIVVEGPGSTPEA